MKEGILNVRSKPEADFMSWEHKKGPDFHSGGGKVTAVQSLFMIVVFQRSDRFQRMIGGKYVATCV